MMTYAQQIKHPMWQKKRLEVLESNNYECENCGDKESTLHVHHPFYKRGAMIWEYSKGELECLCEKCHKAAHALDEQIKKVLANSTISAKHKALGYLQAMDADNYRDRDVVIDTPSYEALAGAFDYLSQFSDDSRKPLVYAFERMFKPAVTGKTTRAEMLGAIMYARWNLQGVFDQPTATDDEKL